MQYCAKFTRRLRDAAAEVPSPDFVLYDDIFNGLEYLQAIHHGNVNKDTVTLLLSLDGAQLCAMK